MRVRFIVLGRYVRRNRFPLRWLKQTFYFNNHATLNTLYTAERNVTSSKSYIIIYYND